MSVTLAWRRVGPLKFIATGPSAQWAMMPAPMAEEVYWDEELQAFLMHEIFTVELYRNGEIYDDDFMNFREAAMAAIEIEEDAAA